jgi:predicted esterase
VSRSERGEDDRIAARLGIEAERLGESTASFQQRPKTILIAGPKGALEPSPLVAALHGMGMRPAKFAEWLRTLFDLPVHWAFPRGPYPFEIHAPNRRGIGFAWYLYTGDQDAFIENLHRVGRHLDAALAAAGRALAVDPGKRVILGFSQGGYLAGHYALRRTPQLAGLAVIGGRIKVESLAKDLDGAARIPILVLHGRGDTAVPSGAARASADRLLRLGFPVEFVEHGGGHEMSGEALATLREWLVRILAEPAPRTPQPPSPSA